MQKLGLIIGISLVLTGCLTTGKFPNADLFRSSGYAVTYQSFPESATVVCDGITKGQTPVTVIYPLDKGAFNSGDSLKIDRCQAVWMSGASQEYPTSIVVNMQQRHTTLGAERPKNSAGLQQDMAFDHQQKASQLELKAKMDTLKLERERLALEKERQALRLDNALNEDEFVNELARYPYSKGTFDVYYGDRKIDGANGHSFEVLRYGYAKDTWNAYYLGQKIANARGNSFVVLAPNYAKDTWNIYYRHQVIPGANSSSFKVLGLGYAKDHWNVYYRGRKIEGANPSTFKVDNNGYGSDIRNRYLNGRLLEGVRY